MMASWDDADVPQAQLLPAPVTVTLAAEQRQGLRSLGLATHWSIEAAERGEGWLDALPAYTFHHSIVIEGPSALYGGAFSPNAWTAGGGLCGLGACSYAHSPLPEGMRVGRYCSIGKGLRFMDFSHPSEWISTSVAFFRPEGVTSTSALAAMIDREGQKANADFVRRPYDPRCGRGYPVLGHDVWIGENVTLALGIRIGTGAVIAAGSIVTRDVPPYAVVAGVPAEVKKLRFADALVERLLAVRWWRYSFVDLNRLAIDQPEHFVGELEDALAAGRILPWQPRRAVLPDEWRQGASACV